MARPTICRNTWGGVHVVLHIVAPLTSPTWARDLVDRPRCAIPDALPLDSRRTPATGTRSSAGAVGLEDRLCGQPVRRRRRLQMERLELGPGLYPRPCPPDRRRQHKAARSGTAIAGTPTPRSSAPFDIGMACGDTQAGYPWVSGTASSRIHAYDEQPAFGDGTCGGNGARQTDGWLVQGDLATNAAAISVGCEPIPDAGKRLRCAAVTTTPRSAVGTVHSQHSSAQIRDRAHSLVNAKRLPQEIKVRRAQNEPTVLGQLAMELEKVLPVERHDCSALANREQEDFAFWPRQPRLPRIANRQDVGRSSSTAGWGKFSSARKRATTQAASFSLICSSMRSRWPLTKAQAFARSPARSDG
jgi:hypothetical protein